MLTVNTIAQRIDVVLAEYLPSIDFRTVYKISYIEIIRIDVEDLRVSARIFSM